MRLLLSNGNSLDVEIKRKNIKNLILRICPDGNARVSAPRRVHEQDIRKFVESKTAWIEKHLVNMEEPLGEHIVRLLGEDMERAEIPAPKNDVLLRNGEVIIYHNAQTKPENVLSGWWRRHALQYLNDSVDSWMVRLDGIFPCRPEVSIRKMKSKWGSCSYREGTIRFNYYLLCAPPQCIDYIVLHEMAHLLYPDHGKRFKAFLARHMPDWKERRRLLNGQPAVYGLY